MKREQLVQLFEVLLKPIVRLTMLVRLEVVQSEAFGIKATMLSLYLFFSRNHINLKQAISRSTSNLRQIYLGKS